MWRKTTEKAENNGKEVSYYTTVRPYGNNHEYFEIKVQQEDFDSSAFQDNSYTRRGESPLTSHITSKSQRQKQMDEVINEVMGVKEQAERSDNLQEAVKSHIEKLSEEKNIDLNIENIEEEKDKYC